MKFILLLGKEYTGGFTDVIRVGFNPWEIDYVSLAENSNELSINNEALVLFINLNSSWESSVDTAVLEEILKIAELFVWSVDGFENSLMFFVPRKYI